MSRPIIGINLDWHSGGGFSTKPYYALRDNYFDMIDAAGGTPIALPPLKDRIPEYIAMIDGLLMPGGDFAFPAGWYAEKEFSPFDESPRSFIDIAYMREALAHDKPVLGICAGMQVLGCMEGGKLSGDIMAYTNTTIDHHKGTDREFYSHHITVIPGSLLYNITQKSNFAVNSAHCEAFVDLPDHVRTCAIAEDSVIEAIELPDHRFALGVQWHPEFFIQDKNPHFMICQAFVAAAAKK